MHHGAFPSGGQRFRIFMLEGMPMIFAAVVFRHRPELIMMRAFQVLPTIGHQLRTAIDGQVVTGVVDRVAHNADKSDDPITVHCVQIAEADSDGQ